MKFLDDGLGNELSGLDVDLEVEFAKPGGGGRTDGGNADAADIASVGIELKEHPEEGVDAIDAGEEEPVVAMGILDELAELHEIGRVLDADGGDFPDIGAEGVEAGGEVAGLLAAAGDDNALAEQGARLEPIERVAKLDDGAKDSDSGGGETGLRDLGGNGIEAAREGLLAAGSGPADEGDG